MCQLPVTSANTSPCDTQCVCDRRCRKAEKTSAQRVGKPKASKSRRLRIPQVAGATCMRRLPGMPIAGWPNCGKLLDCRFVAGGDRSGARWLTIAAGFHCYLSTRSSFWERKRRVKADARSAARSDACGPRFGIARNKSPPVFLRAIAVPCPSPPGRDRHECTLRRWRRAGQDWSESRSAGCPPVYFISRRLHHTGGMPKRAAQDVPLRSVRSFASHTGEAANPAAYARIASIRPRHTRRCDSRSAGKASWLGDCRAELPT